MRKLLKGVHEFQTNYFSSHREMFEKLSLGQHPRILFITCSDSRIDPNLICQTEPGELFIIRNVGNIVPPYSVTSGGEGAAIEYAVESLGIKSIIVCGHSHCGAMKGLLQLGNLAEQMPEGEELLNAAIEENVLTQIENLRSYPVVHSKLYNGQLNIYAWVYKLETGGVFVYSAERCNIKAEHEEEDSDTEEALANPVPLNGNKSSAAL